MPSKLFLGIFFGVGRWTNLKKNIEYIGCSAWTRQERQARQARQTDM